MTRTDRIEQAILAALERHAPAIDQGLNVTHVQVDIKFDRSTGAPTKAVISMEQESFIRETNLDQFTFHDVSVYNGKNAT
jgi:hypothetical protein